MEKDANLVGWPKGHKLKDAIKENRMEADTEYTKPKKMSNAKEVRSIEEVYENMGIELYYCGIGRGLGIGGSGGELQDGVCLEMQ